jgi:hypothetical protein
MAVVGIAGHEVGEVIDAVVSGVTTARARVPARSRVGVAACARIGAAGRHLHARHNAERRERGNQREQPTVRQTGEQVQSY